MLAGVAANAVTQQISNLAILIFELNGIGLRPLHNGIPLCDIQAEITNPVFYELIAKVNANDTLFLRSFFAFTFAINCPVTALLALL